MPRGRMPLTAEETQRYSRQLALPEIGNAGQESLRAASVLVIGAGGLGSPAALYLAAAGVGCLGLADPDQVELSNLQRQVLHATRDVGRLKVESGRARILELNPGARVEALALRLDARNLPALLAGFDFVLSCVDSFSAKYAISDACVAGRKPFCQAGIQGLQGQVFTYVPSRGAGCFRCLYPGPTGEDEPNGPVLGSVAGVLGSLQATEALKWILGLSGLLLNRMLCFDGGRMQVREIAFQPDPNCPACRRGGA